MLKGLIPVELDSDLFQLRKIQGEEFQLRLNYSV